MSRTPLKYEDEAYEGLFSIVQMPPTEENMRLFEQMLRDNPTSVNDRTPHGQTPLFFAREEYVPGLIAAGADVNAKDSHFATPIIVAAAEQTPNKIKMLLNAGANPLQKSLIGPDDASALAWAERRSRENMFALLISDQIPEDKALRVFKMYNWDVSAPDYGTKLSEFLRERAWFRRRQAVKAHTKQQAEIWGNNMDGGGRRGRTHRRRSSQRRRKTVYHRQ